MVEMAVSLSVLMILTAIAIPTLMRSFRTYQLNDAAARLSGLLKFTRFEAVRRNRQTCFLTKQNGYAWTLGTDSICSGTLDTNGKQQVITGFATLLPGGSSGLPGQGAICGWSGAVRGGYRSVLPARGRQPSFLVFEGYRPLWSPLARGTHPRTQGPILLKLCLRFRWHVEHFHSERDVNTSGRARS